MIVAVGTGSGATAAAALEGGADLIAYYNTAAYRIRGLPTALSFLPYDNCNELAHAISGEVVAAVGGRVPVLAGVGVHDPRIPLAKLIDIASQDGADGVMNEPFVSIYGPEIRGPLEDAGLGFSRELRFLEMAVARGMTTLGWAFDSKQAAMLAGAGATYVGAMAGVMQAGDQSEEDLVVAIEHLSSMAEAAHSENPSCLVLGHGGPFSSPHTVSRLMKHGSLDGFMTGSNGERIPLNKGVREAIAEFKDIPSRRSPYQANRR